MTGPPGSADRPVRGALSTLGSLLARPFARLRPAGATRFELVCPFHRGDLLLAIQVAHTVHSLGHSVRLHTSSDLRAWAESFDCPFPVHYLSTPVVPPEQALEGVARALSEVAALPDASKRIVRFHPARGLRLSREHLLDTVLDQFGLRPRRPPLRALAPALRAGDAAEAEALLREWTAPIVLVQSHGGWSLKSLPTSVGARLREIAKRSGATLVQIGGPDDPLEDWCDGSIRRVLSPSRWRAVFERSAAVLTVDSFSAHFAAILDVPHAVFYGPTDAQLIHSHPRFAQRRAASVVVRSAVPCSPCETLVCGAFPGATRCAGYDVGPSWPAAALGELMSSAVPRAG